MTTITPTDIHRLIAAIGTTRLTDHRNRVALLLMYRCGLTVSEVCELPAAAVDLDRRVLHITGKRKRDVPIPDDVVPHAVRWQAIRPAAPTWLCSTQGTKLTQQSWRNVVKELAHTIGLYQEDGKPPSPADLRTACAKEMLERYPVDEVIRLMGYRGRASLAKGIGCKVGELTKVKW